MHSYDQVVQVDEKKIKLSPARTLEAVDKDPSSTLQCFSNPGTARREVFLDPNEGTVVDRKGEQLDPPPLQLVLVRLHAIWLSLEACRIQKMGHSLK